MRNVLSRPVFRLIPLIALFSLIGPTFSAQHLRAQDGVEVEVIIRNSTYEFHGGILRPGEAAVIRLQNTDDITHGFMSEIFEKVEVEIETAGGVVYGKEIHGVHIQPGEEIEIRFTPQNPGQFSFRCDLHPKMKGELLVMTVGTA